MSDFKKIELIKPTSNAVSSTQTAEGRYWSKFNVASITKEFGAVNHIDFSPTEPHNYAVTASTRVLIYDATTNEVDKTLTRFKDVAYGATFRRDGRLLAVGGAHPLVQVFDVSARTLLRAFRGHTGAVRVTRFAADNTRVVSMSDDRSVRAWDLSSETSLDVISGAHDDYIRGGAASRVSPDVWYSGSYDKTIKTWDLRVGNQSSNVVATFDHGEPVESLLTLPGGSLLVSAGGNKVKIWDLLTGRALTVLQNHQKTVTGLCIDGTKTRLMSCGLDRMIKVYDLKTYAVTHSLRCAAPLLAVATSPDSSLLAYGGVDGSLAVRRRLVKQSERVRSRRRDDDVRAGTYRYFVRGKNVTAGHEDLQVEARRQHRLQPYEKLLKKFRYREALKSAFETSRPVVIVSMFAELQHRQALETSLSGLNDVELVPILNFLTKHIVNNAYSAVLLDVTDVVLDLYGSVVGASPVVVKAVEQLSNRIRLELKLQKQLFEVSGVLDMLMAQSINSHE